MAVAHNKRNAQVSNDADHRSQYGAPQASKLKCGGIVPPLGFALLIVAMIIFTGISALATASCSQRGPSNSTTTPTATKPRSAVNLQNYEKLQTGMSYNEVAEILGTPDKEIRDNEMAEPRAVTCVWGGDQLGSISVVFQGNRLVEKSQYGLQ